MNFEQAKQEMVDRGYNYISTARLGTFLQRAYRKICTRRDWPFLEEEVTKKTPYEIKDLRKILSVSDVTNERPVTGVDRRWLVSTFPNLAETGIAEFWYLENKTFKTYPIDTAEYAIRYIRRTELLADADTSLIPEEWEGLWLDLAAVSCLRDNDEQQEARELKADTEVELKEMAADLMSRNHQNPGFIVRTGRPGVDYL